MINTPPFNFLKYFYLHLKFLFLLNLKLNLWWRNLKLYLLSFTYQTVISCIFLWKGRKAILLLFFLYIILPVNYQNSVNDQTVLGCSLITWNIMMQAEIGLVRIVQIINVNSKNISLVRCRKWATTPFFVLKTLLLISYFDTDLPLFFFFFFFSSNALGSWTWRYLERKFDSLLGRHCVHTWIAYDYLL